MKASHTYPLMSHIRHFSLDDGPGIRSTVFLKGCPLVCVWCHNPESIDAGVQLGFDPRLCVRCGWCEAICHRKAISMNRGHRIIRYQCNLCLKCAEKCPSKAIYRIGVPYAPSALADLLLSERLSYQDTGSGVTFSGGEPTLYMDYLREVFEVLKRHDVHIALQTCGFFDVEDFKEKLLPYIDLLYYDLKLMSPRDHRRYTGRSNRRIRRNFQILTDESGIAVIPTIPLVPGITATAENLESTAAFLGQSGCRHFELRPYHPGGRHKRIAIGLAPLADTPDRPLSLEALSNIASEFQSLLDVAPQQTCTPRLCPGPRNLTDYRSKRS